MGAKRDEVMGLERIYNEEPYDLYSIPHTIGVIKLIGMSCGTYGRQETYIQGFVGET
jgi:hypothetical protein